MTTALVLAAGLGTRLRSVTSERKWSVPVADTTPMDQQLHALDRLAAVDRVVAVVSGDTAELRRQIDEMRLTTPVELIDNPDAHRLNNWSSALVGLHHIGDGAVILLNSDLFAHRDWLLESMTQTMASDVPALLIDDVRDLTDEAMKVAGHGGLTSIGKVGVEDPVGEYVGIAWWPQGRSRSFRTMLDAFRHEPSATQNWYEHGIGDDMAAGTPYAKVSTPSTDWVEIDDETDHRTALSLWEATR